MKQLRLTALALAAISTCLAADKVLVYTRNYTPDGKGYVHDNIATSVEAIRSMGLENGFEVDASDDPKLFTTDHLKKYKAIVFSNSNNEAFENDAQREALQKFVRAGGGVVGIHSATGSERKWPYFWSLMGGRFIRHPVLQKFTVLVKDTNHPSTAGLPAKFEWEDECYLFDQANSHVRVLLAADPAQLQDPKRTEQPGALREGQYPLAWYNTADGGRQYYIALGHKKEHYADPIFRRQVLGGILWVLGRKR
ncbi:MAG TPA: ThuA domain-containing protein [Bryobacteraceae bacterium]|nr:ThuA domain-containing protein [Bryobacteraceae bacterium]